MPRIWHASTKSRRNPTICSRRLVTVETNTDDPAKRGSGFVFFARDLLEPVHHLENAVCRCAEFANDLAVVGVLLLFENPPCVIDVAKALRDQLTLGVGDAEGTICDR